MNLTDMKRKESQFEAQKMIFKNCLVYIAGI